VTRLWTWKVLLPVLLGVMVIAVAGLAIGGCYYSDQLKQEALETDHSPAVPDLEVIGLPEGRVALEPMQGTNKDGDWTKEGVYGLEWDDGYGQVGAIVEMDAQRVVREFVTLQGSLDVGDLVRLDSFAWPNDPQQAFGIPFEEVTFASPLGDFPGWFVDGPADTWVIFVHGRGSDRREALRTLPSVTELGFPSLIITYRNDAEAPASPDGFYRFGQTEWQDLEGAVRYAVQHGAEGLVLVGYSMGGAIVTNFLYQSLLAERVDAVILDAPMLNFRDAVDRLAWKQGVPWFFTQIAEKLAEIRFDVDWEAMDYLRRSDELTAPILLFHGDADETVPVETSDALAEARPDLVTYLRVAGAGHVRSWNTDPEAYEAAVRDFLTPLVR
jgi:alpha-beta hydrolase superfamily lysophospholipase